MQGVVPASIHDTNQSSTPMGHIQHVTQQMLQVTQLNIQQTQVQLQVTAPTKTFSIPAPLVTQQQQMQIIGDPPDQSHTQDASLQQLADQIQGQGQNLQT